MADDNEIKVVFSGDATPIAASAKQASAAIEQVAATANASTTGLNNFSKAIQAAPTGVENLSRSLSQLPAAIGRIEGVTRNTIPGITGLADALGPVLGVAVIGAVVGIEHLVKEYGSLSNAVSVFLGDTTKMAIEQEKFNISLAEAGAHAAGEVAELRSLVSVAQDEVLSRAARQQAIDKLNATYPQFHKNLSIENINTEKIAVAVDKVTDALVRQAKVKGVTAEIEKEAGVQAELNADLSKSVGVWDAVGAAMRSVGSTSAYVNNLVVTGLKNRDKALAESLQKTQIYTKTLDDLNKQGAIDGTLFTEKPDKAKPEKAAKTLEQLFSKINEQAGKDWQKLIDQADREEDRYFSQIEKGLKDEARVQKVIDALNHTNQAIRDGIVDIQGKDAGAAIPITQNVAGSDKLQQILNQYKQLNAKPANLDAIKDAGAKALILAQNLDKVQKVANATGAAVQQILAPAFQQLFTSLISGSQNALQAVSSFFKDLLVQIVSTIAKAAALAAILSLIPGFSTASGASGFSGIFKDLLGFGKGAGLNYEGSGNAYALVAKLNGNDIDIALTRSKNSRGRLGG